MSEVQYRPGRIQTIEPDQEIVLKQVWAYLLKFWGYGVDISNEDIACKDTFVSSGSLARVNTQTTTSHPHKSRWRLFKKRAPVSVVSSLRSHQLENPSTYTKITQPSDKTRQVFLDLFGELQKYDEEIDDSDTPDTPDTLSVSSFVTAFTNLPTSPLDLTETLDGKNSSNPPVCLKGFDAKTLHQSMLGTLRNELVDNFILRFVRARKFDANNAIAMLARSLEWRATAFPVNKWVMEGDAPSFLAKTNMGFVGHYTKNKSIIRGQDKHGNPIFIFRPRHHHADDAPLPETKRYAIVTIEWARLFFRDVNELVDQASAIFDMTGFSMKNADNVTTKFLAEIFEAHYPESLGHIMVHNAPWIFSTIWNIIKNWLDPVVKSKVHFTKSTKDLAQFVDPSHLPAELGGDDQYKIEYVEPESGSPKPKDQTFWQLVKERDNLLMLFFDTTRLWVEATDPVASAAYLKDKIDLSTKLAENYIYLDPYVRVPGLYDRNGFLQLKT